MTEVLFFENNDFKSIAMAYGYLRAQELPEKRRSFAVNFIFDFLSGSLRTNMKTLTGTYTKS